MKTKSKIDKTLTKEHGNIQLIFVIDPTTEGHKIQSIQHGATQCPKSPYRNLIFKREVSQADHYNPTNTENGKDC